jgi:hypothetical protein
VGGAAFAWKVHLDHEAAAREDRNFLSTLIDEARFGIQPFLVNLTWQQRAAVTVGVFLLKRAADEAERRIRD